MVAKESSQYADVIQMKSGESNSAKSHSCDCKSY